jgi:hypothetical protein
VAGFLPLAKRFVYIWRRKATYGQKRLGKPSSPYKRGPWIEILPACRAGGYLRQPHESSLVLQNVCLATEMALGLPWGFGNCYHDKAPSTSRSCCVMAKQTR